MTPTTAKKITLRLLDRWEAARARMSSKGVRFVVLKNRFPQPGRQDAGYIFSNRQEALIFGESHYRGDFAMMALTEHGSIDLTPE